VNVCDFIPGKSCKLLGFIFDIQRFIFRRMIKSVTKEIIVLKGNANTFSFGSFFWGGVGGVPLPDQMS